MTRVEALDRGRASFQRRAWRDAYARISAADRQSSLAGEDLERLAIAAHLVGEDAASRDSYSRAHQAFLAEGDAPRAARCAFWLGFFLSFEGEMAQAGGWLARAGRLLEECGQDCVEQGYLLVPAGIRSIQEGDLPGALASFVTAAEIGRRFRDPDLVAFATHGHGRALIGGGDTAKGVTLLDEAMVSITAGEVSPVVAGIVYCSVLEACREILDLGRAQEWTTALEHWCASQPELTPYRGHCMLSRAEILQLHGAWPDALDEAERAREQLSRPAPRSPVGAAFYRLGEIHRLRGEFARAEEAYRQTSQWQQAPHAGLALMRLAQGQVEAALATIRRVADEVRQPSPRSQVLEALVEIALAAGDVPAARTGADELASITARLDAPLLRAMSDEAEGAVRLAEGDAREALAALRRAGDGWRALDAPYRVARVRVLIARTCRALGDEDAAGLELDAARATFERLGAAPDLARIAALSPKSEAGGSGPLTGRELQVLVLVATGKTNRAIAAKLEISEKTVARHLSNIFTKLDLPSRAAATAYAYDHHLVRAPLH